MGAAPGGSSDLRLPLPDGIARLKAMSTLSAWSDAKAAAAANNGTGTGNVGASSSSSKSSAIVVRASSAVSNATTINEDDDDDDHPPLLDALERSTAGGTVEGAGGSKDRDTARSGVSPPLFTPKRQSTAMSLSWGATSPWMPGSAQRSEQGWLSRLAMTGSQTPPANSSAAAAAAGVGGGNGHGEAGRAAAAAAVPGGVVAASPRAGGGLVVHFPAPPQSLLPVFDRELHGFDDTAATEEDRWGDLPFLVVESWGGLGKEAPPGRGKGEG